MKKKLWGAGGHYIESRGNYNKVSLNADFITLETHVQQGKINNKFFMYFMYVKQCTFLAISGESCRAFNYQKICPSCFQAIFSPISVYMSNNETI